MLELLLSSLLILAQDPTIPHSTELPDTVDQAITRCERLEYAQPQDAIRVAEHGLSLQADLTPTQRGFLLACRAWSQMQLGQMDEARELTLEVDQLATEVGDPSQRVGLLMRLASLYYRGGDPITSIEAMDLALELTEGNGLDEDLPQVLGNLAIYLTESGQFEPAIDHFERILALPQNQDAPPEALTPVYYNLARALLLDNQPERALAPLEIVIPTLRGPGLEPRLATALSMTGSAWRQLGDLEKAQALISQAAALHETFDNPGERTGLRRDQALLARDLGNLEAAERYAREALDLARQIQYERSILDGQKNLVDILEQRGQFEEALSIHRDYAELNQSFLEESQRSRHNALETQLGMQRQARELDELRQTAEIQQLRLKEESLKRQVAWGALIAVLILGIILSIWQRANQKRLLKASRTDSLTGLANRRYLTLQMQTHNSDPRNAVLILMDLDHFKQVNDRNGHDVGDQVLIEVSDLLKQLALDHAALCGRWGGEEFALYLPEANRESAAALCEAIRQGIAALKVRNDQGDAIAITASMGFAPIGGFTRDSGEEFWEPAMKAADQLLYRAKNDGRNRGMGTWPDANKAPIDPLALTPALDAGELPLILVTQNSG